MYFVVLPSCSVSRNDDRFSPFLSPVTHWRCLAWNGPLPGGKISVPNARHHGVIKVTWLVGLTKMFKDTATMVGAMSSSVLVYGLSRKASHDNLIDFFFDHFAAYGIVDVRQPRLPRLGFCSVRIVFESPEKASKFIKSGILPLKMTQLRRR